MHDIAQLLKNPLKIDFNINALHHFYVTCSELY
jgi:hypothetical protein